MVWHCVIVVLDKKLSTSLPINLYDAPRWCVTSFITLCLPWQFSSFSWIIYCVLCLYTIGPNILCVYNVYTMCIMYTMCIQCVYNVYKMCIQCVYNVYTMCIQVETDFLFLKRNTIHSFLRQGDTWKCSGLTSLYFIHKITTMLAIKGLV